MKRLLVAVVLAVLVASSSWAAGASTVRGLLFRVGPDGRSYPAANVATRLNHPAYGPSSFAYSGADGMYYLYNVPPGQFTLEIWLNQRDILRYQVAVGQAGFTDVPPIRVP